MLAQQNFIIANVDHVSCTLLCDMSSCSPLLQEAEDMITDLQKELFKAQGVDGGWGIQCLGQVGDTYQDDTDFMKLFVTAVERCSSTHPWQYFYMYA